MRNQGKPVFRVRRRRTLGLSLVGMFAGTLGAGIAQSLLVLPVVFVAATVIGYLWRTSYCTDPSCHEEIDPTAKTCPGCGGLVAGDIDKDSQRLDALEAYEDKQRKAQEAA
mgnify:CR=1 FL=1